MTIFKIARGSDSQLLSFSPPSLPQFIPEFVRGRTAVEILPAGSAAGPLYAATLRRFSASTVTI